MTKWSAKTFFVIVTTSLLFFLSVAFDITPYLRGPAPYVPEWRWAYNFVNTVDRIWFPLIIITTILTIGVYLEKRIGSKNFKNIYPTLILFIILGFLFQISVLYFSRNGINVLLHRVINPDLNGYFTVALNITSVHDFLQEYNENVLSFPMHAKGHPPGGILFFWLINKIFSIVPFLNEITNRLSPARADVKFFWDSLNSYQKTGAIASGFIISFLSSVSIVPLYYLGKYLYGQITAFRSIVLYTFIPSVILFTPLFDTIFPIFSITALYLYLKGSQKKPIFLFLSGFILSLGIFFSLSLLPIIFLFFFIAFFKTIIKRTNIFLQEITLFGFFILGGLLFPIILFIFFHFNFLEVGKIIIGGQAPRSYILWLFYNLYDFLIFSGIPVLIAFVLLFWRFSKTFLKESLGKFDHFLPAFISILILLDISGISRAETGRIWLPLTPFLVLFAIRYFTKDLKLSTYAFMFIVFLEAIQVLIFQEFWVTLW